MISKLNQLSARTMSLIGEFAAKNDVEAINRLSGTATKIKGLQESLAAIEHDASDLEIFLNGFTKSPANEPLSATSRITNHLEPSDDAESRSRGKKLRVEIDWSRLEKPGGKEVICERMASDTMTKFVHRLYAAFGISTLEKLSSFRVSRGPLVSKDPNRDFSNRSNGTLYSHQRVSGTSFYVLTHSQTSQKVGDVKEACRHLGLPIGAVKVTEVEKPPHDF